MCVTSSPCSRKAMTRRMRRGRRRNRRQCQVTHTYTHTHTHKIASTNPVPSPSRSPVTHTDLSSPHTATRKLPRPPLPRSLLLSLSHKQKTLSACRNKQQQPSTPLREKMSLSTADSFFQQLALLQLQMCFGKPCEPLIKDLVSPSASSLPAAAAVTAFRYVANYKVKTA